MAAGLGIFKFFLWFGLQNNRFRQIGQNEETAARSKLFGVKALCFILIGIPLGAATAFGGLMLASGGDVFPVILGIFAVILGGGIILVMLPYSLTCIVFQLRLNKRAIGFVALVLFLAVIVGAAVLFLQLIQ